MGFLNQAFSSRPNPIVQRLVLCTWQPTTRWHRVVSWRFLCPSCSMGHNSSSFDPLINSRLGRTTNWLHPGLCPSSNWYNRLHPTPYRGWSQFNNMGLPISFEENCVLKLDWSLYGLKQSPKNFFLLLKETLEKIGYSQSTHDPCLFYKGSTICHVYVDNCIFYSTSRTTINADLDLLKQQSLDFNIEDSVAGFLGIHLHRYEETGVIQHMTQVGLIDHILVALDLEDCNPKATPALTEPLPKDTDGTPFNGTYNYPSVLGMLSHLYNYTRSDIAFAVHQCARFAHPHRATCQISSANWKVPQRDPWLWRHTSTWKVFLYSKNWLLLWC